MLFFHALIEWEYLSREHRSGGARCFPVPGEDGRLLEAPDDEAHSRGLVVHPLPSGQVHVPDSTRVLSHALYQERTQREKVSTLDHFYHPSINLSLLDWLTPFFLIKVT